MGNPVLGEVIRILISDQGIVVLFYERLELVHYVKHLNAYRVVNSGEMDYIAQDKLIVTIILLENTMALDKMQVAIL